MALQDKTIKELLDTYLNEYVTIKIINYIGDTNPSGGRDQGVNLDVGETHSFDLKIENKGGTLNTPAAQETLLHDLFIIVSQQLNCIY